MNADFEIALAGNPNAGKTTLFNALTGSRQHVGNYPGVTVEKKEGIYVGGGHSIRIVDLPGTYSLTAYSEEEVVARDYLLNARPRVVVNIVDAANLERNLYLTSQFMEMGVPLVLALNMIDVARDRGISIDHERLAGLLGVPVVPIVARKGQGTPALMAEVARVAAAGRKWHASPISYGDDLDAVILDMVAKIKAASFLTAGYPPRWTAVKFLEGDARLKERGMAENPELCAELTAMVKDITDHLQETAGTFPEALIADHRYGYIKSVLMQGVMSYQFDAGRLHTSDRIDKVLTNRFFGPIVMVGVLMGLYQFTFSLSERPIAWVQALVDWLAAGAQAVLPPGPLESLVVSGVIHGVGGVLGFVPLIMLMFFGLAFLEDSGYLARVAFMLDRVFRTFGLHGNSVMAYIVSGGIAGGCAVPGVMATRTLRSRRERMATLLTAPFMNCGAKLPVLALLIDTFFAEHQARFMLFSTLLAWIVALCVAKFYRLTILKGEPTPFVMELPPYRFPTLKGLLIHTWEKTWRYIQKAGTVILAVSILLWAMMTYPGLPAAKKAEFARQRQEITARVQGPERQRALAAVDRAEGEAKLVHSAAGRLGRALETVSRLPGFDWRTNIALIGGVAAKEVIVSTMSTAYALSGDAADGRSLARTLAAQPGWSPLLSLSLIVFTMFYAPCIITVVCIVKEAGSWRWGLFAVAFNTGFAYLLATLVYRLGGLVWPAGG